MTRYKVRCEDRIQFDVFVTADNEQDAKEKAEEEIAYGRKRTATLDLYDFISVIKIK